MEGKKFNYRLPRSAVSDASQRTAVAYRGSVPGLLIQEAIDGSGEFVLVHEKSGAIVPNLRLATFRQAEEKYTSISRFPLKWNGTGEELLRSIGALKARDAKAFLEATNHTYQRGHKRRFLKAARRMKAHTRRFKRGT